EIMNLSQYVTNKWICDELITRRTKLARKRATSFKLRFLWYKLERKIPVKPTNTPRPNVTNISILRPYPINNRIIQAVATFLMEFQGLSFL
ncbi:MAG TPA: hypothetical protein VHO92_04295, partial [Methanobacterium sp.]|nr:hypothetical protein [Methanobacterium sp.]